MKAKPLPPAETLRKLLHYDPDSGLLSWRRRTPDLFIDGRYSAERLAKTWNNANAGKPALDCPSSKGYLRGAVHYGNYLSHRVIWKMMTGEDPIEVDHINGIRTDNRWSNLMAVDHRTNMKNRGLSRNNTSGYVGVHQTGKSWQATITVNGRAMYLGRYKRLEDAVDHRRRAEAEHGYHPNHGTRAGYGTSCAGGISPER